MIGDKNVLAIIPARGGSKGLPGKNLMELGGRPMIAWTIEAALESAYLDQLIVTTDDEAIAAAARNAGCDVPFMRPEGLAGDEARVEAAVFHALDQLSDIFDLIVLLQPTSPLRLTADIDGCIEACLNADAPSAVSVCETSKSPYWMYQISDLGVLVPVLALPDDGYRRQNLPLTYVTNGAVYVIETGYLRQHGQFVTDQTVPYIMPAERSIDVDSKLDYQLADWLIRQNMQGV